jgi:transcriptional regulator with XRE-family HTH domain
MCPIHDYRAVIPYISSVYDIAADPPGRRFAALIREARALKGMSQGALEAASDVSRQTISRYESGAAVSPKALELRAVLAVLGVDPREAVVALGYVTREEMDLPPAAPPLDPIVAEVQRYLNDGRLPDWVRGNLRRGVQAARDLWLDWARTPALKEPSARGVPAP